jgi:hypothetical protein
LRSKHGLRLLWLCRTCDGIRGLPKVLHGMQHVRTQPQDERVSESRLYQVPGHRTYGVSALSAIRAKQITRRTHAARYVSRQDSAGTRTRVRTVSDQLPGITHASALSAIRAKQIMRRTNVRISNAHNARNTVMMRSDVLKSPRLCAMHAAPARTKRQGQSIVRSTNAQRAKAN